MYVIFTDSDTDLTLKQAKEFGYEMISMPYSIDGKTTYPYVDFETFEPHPFYEQMRNGAMPTTSAITKESYVTYFEPFFAAGRDILYVHFSRAMSASFDSMDQAVAELKEKYPERRFEEVDTKGITIGSLNIVEEIGDMYKAGKSMDEILDWAKDEVDHFAVYFFADDLKFFRRSGRVSGLAATMGTLIGIRPIIYMNSEGKMVSIGKEKGRSKAIERLASYVDELGDHVTDHRIIVATADNDEFGDELEALLKERYGKDIRLERTYVNPTAGAHCGPDTMGVSFHAIHR